MRHNRLFAFFIVVLLLMAVWAARAQNTDEGHVYFTAIKPGQHGSFVHRSAEPLVVNYKGALIGQAGRYLLTPWENPEEYWISLRVVDSLHPDTMLVRVRSGYVREKRTPRYRLNYVQKIASNQRIEFPSAGNGNARLPAGMFLLVPKDLSGSTVGDSSVIYLHRYGGVAVAEESHRAISYYGRVGTALPDTGATLSWKGLRRLSFSMRADDDSCMVRILARIYSGGWGAASHVLADSTLIGTTLFNQFSMARDSVPPGDSLQVIVVPLTPFSAEPVPFGAVARGEF